MSMYENQEERIKNQEILFDSMFYFRFFILDSQFLSVEPNPWLQHLI